MRTAFAFVFGLLVAGSAGCTDNGVLPARGDQFRYTGYDSTGKAIISGVLTIEIQDSSHCEGTWEFSAIGNTGTIGPQVGKGVLSGRFSDGYLEVGLNPAMVDNNVQLRGILSDADYSGRWTYVGFPGIISYGTFEAIR